MTEIPRAVNGRLMLEGMTFGEWLVVRPLPRTTATLMYECLCNCGTIRDISSQGLREGKTRSCGCKKSEHSSASLTVHGMSHKSLHNVWWGMHQRCTDPNCEAWPRYGGRGIKVCERWRDYLSFVEDMGTPEPGMTIERINNDGFYEKANCRWATRMEQANNRRSNRFLDFEGKRQTMAQWEREKGLTRGSLWERFNRGWSLELALTTPMFR